MNDPYVDACPKTKKHIGYMRIVASNGICPMCGHNNHSEYTHVERIKLSETTDDNIMKQLQRLNEMSELKAAKKMAWRIVRQPNGKLARFSDVVDNFTHMDLTRWQAVKLCRQYMASDEAVKKVQSGVDDIMPWGIGWGNGLDRWNDCLETISMVHGREAVERIKFDE